jgi:hypothetical protein
MGRSRQEAVGEHPLKPRGGPQSEGTLGAPPSIHSAVAAIPAPCADLATRPDSDPVARRAARLRPQVDFFADSAPECEWGVLLSLLDDMRAGRMRLPPNATLAPESSLEASDKRERGWLRPVAFDAAAHTLLCSELKLL